MTSADDPKESFDEESLGWAPSKQEAQAMDMRALMQQGETQRDAYAMVAAHYSQTRRDVLSFVEATGRQDRLAQQEREQDGFTGAILDEMDDRAFRRDERADRRVHARCGREND